MPAVDVELDPSNPQGPKADVFRLKIGPLLKQLKAVCEQHGIGMLANFELDRTGGPTGSAVQASFAAGIRSAGGPGPHPDDQWPVDNPVFEFCIQAMTGNSEYADALREAAAATILRGRAHHAGHCDCGHSHGVNSSGGQG